MMPGRKFLARTALVALLALLPTLAHAAAPPAIPQGWSEGYTYANGIRIHYYHAVPAPGKQVILMVHGVTDCGLTWATITPKLQDAYDIYMVDTRGHGLSDPFTPADNGDTLIKDVVEFVHAMKFEKPILMGHSMGGATVMRVGGEYRYPSESLRVHPRRLFPRQQVPGALPAARPGRRLQRMAELRRRACAQQSHARRKNSADDRNPPPSPPRGNILENQISYH